MGEMLFTHFGIGGPITLLMSLAIVEALEEGPVSVSIDLKPALTVEELRARLQGDFDRYGKRGFHNLLAGLLPQKMIGAFVELSGIPRTGPGIRSMPGSGSAFSFLLKSLRFQHQGPSPPVRGDCHGRRGFAQGNRSPDDGLPPCPRTFLLRRGDGSRRRYGGLQPPGGLLHRLCRRCGRSHGSGLISDIITAASGPCGIWTLDNTISCGGATMEPLEKPDNLVEFLENSVAMHPDRPLFGTKNTLRAITNG